MSNKEELIIYRPTYSQEHVDLSKKYLGALKNKIKDTQKVTLKETNNVAVIVEPRKHEMLEMIVRNVMYFLGEDWNLHIFGGNLNEKWVNELFPEDWEYRFTNLGVDNITADEHNLLLKQRFFWQEIKEENILIFQTDSFLLRRGIEPIFEYDYAGAETMNQHEKSPKGIGQNGGLSFRKRSSMLDCIDNVYEYMINEYRVKNGKLPFKINSCILAEDIYFYHSLEILNKKFLPMELCGRFSMEAPSIENGINLTPLGMHAINKNMLQFKYFEKIMEMSEMHKFLEET